MKSIKSSFANCLGCKLLDSPSCIMETNSKDDLSKVDIVFVSENPGKDEIKKEVPLIGRAGQTFRKYFNKYVKNNCKWLLTNCVLCLTLNEDGNTGNPDDETIENCKENCFRIIDACNPKLIVLMGTSPMKAFGIAKSGITNLRGQTFSWRDYEVLVTVHPSFVNRNRSFEDKFEQDIIDAANLVSFLDKPLENVNRTHTTGEKGIHRYKIPDKFYTDEYRLVDIQFLSVANKVLYIFRDRNNNKIYHEETDSYYCYQVSKEVEAKKIVPYDELEQLCIKYKDKVKLDHSKTYEGDMRITAKHAIDYYHYNQDEAPRVSSNILFCDIEIDTGIDNRVFPEAKLAKYPINMITCKYQEQNIKICYVLDNGSEPIVDKPETTIKTFKTERNMLLQFISDFHKYDPDFMAGWNFIGFDMEYIYNRLPKVKIKQQEMSKFKEFYVDGFRFSCKLPGCVVIDQMHLYKMFTFTKKENYTLGFIGKEELGITKIELELPINEMYWKKLNRLIEYNIRDVDLIEKLEESLAHIKLLNEIRTICKSSFEAASSSFGQIDCIVVSFLKEKAMASKNSDPHITKEDYPGAFVLAPKPGIYSKMADFDFTSLYPSIIMTYNIGMNNFVMRTKDPHVGFDLAYDKDNLDEMIEVFIDPMFKNKLVMVKKEDLIKKIKDSNLIHTINGCFYQSHKDNLSIYSQVLEDLLSSRRVYKKKMLDAKEAKDKEAKDFYNIRQLVYKVLANALYGVIANKAFRFFDVSCAAAITLGGQEALKSSIIEGDAFMEHLDTKKVVIRPNRIDKREMYAEEMPDRKTSYIVTGDTDSIFCCFEKFSEEKTTEKIRDWCNQLQSYLNSVIMEEIVTSHNASMEYNKLDLKNELIISRGLFLAKKRYAIHVVNNEGRDVDETKYMGLEIKRSDWGSDTKKFMKELLETILKDEKVTLPKLFRFIEKKEREFRHLIMNGSKTVARPVTYGKNLKSYKLIPQGVRAMENWNKLMYHAHRQGSKGYLFHIKGIDLNKAPQDIAEKYDREFLSKGVKLDIIGLPDEEERLPEFLVPDINAQLKTAFIDRHKLMLEPLTQVKKMSEILLI